MTKQGIRIGINFNVTRNKELVMKLSTQIALIISALVLPLSAYAKEGENSKQTITVQPQTEIATRANEMVGRGDGMGGLTSFRGGSVALGNPFSKVNINAIRDSFTPNVATLVNNKKNWESAIGKIEKATNNERDKDREKEKNQRESEKIERKEREIDREFHRD